MTDAPLSEKISLRDRFRGCLMGLAIGDAVGAPFEGLTGETIYRDFGFARKLVANPQNGPLTYTDDTQMTIGVAECLLARGEIHANFLAELFGKNYETGRGYGPGGRRILDAMVLGQDWRKIVENVFPGGSFGNGAAMRVAPVGLFFHHDLERARLEAKKSAEVTHLHPLGIDGAVIIATGVGVLLRDGGFMPATFFEELLRSTTTEEFHWQISTASRLGPNDSFWFGSTLAAHRSVTTAIRCFMQSPDSFEKTISSAIALGEDTDTIAAIAGALSGACLGIGAIPRNLIDRLENGPKGRAYIEKLAADLFEKWTETQRRG